MQFQLHKRSVVAAVIVPCAVQALLILSERIFGSAVPWNGSYALGLDQVSWTPSERWITMSTTDPAGGAVALVRYADDTDRLLILAANGDRSEGPPTMRFGAGFAIHPD